MRQGTTFVNHRINSCVCTPSRSALYISVVGINLAGWIGYLIAGFVGACLLIWIVRAFKKA